MARTSGENSTFSRFLVLASVCIVVAALYFAQEVLIPLALAVLISFLLNPVVSRLERWLGRTPSVLVVVLLGLGGFVVIGWVVKNQFVQIAEQLPSYRQDIRLKLDRFRNSASPLQNSIAEIEKVATTQPASMPAAATKGIFGAGAKEDAPWTPQHPLPTRNYAASSPVQEAGAWLKTMLAPLTTAGLVIAFAIFMLIARESLRDRIIRLTGDGQLNVTTQALDEASTRISRYLLAQGIVNTGYGCCVTGGLWLLGRPEGGFPSVLLWGLLCGLLRFVPYIGIWIAAAFPIILSFALFKGSGVFISTIVLFTAMEVGVGQFIEPYLYGSSTGMSPLAVLVAAVFWTWLWGPVGLLLSTPLTVCLVVIGKYVPPLKFLDILLGDEPVLDPPVRIYQRLISLDADEAAEVAREYFKDHSLEETYDHLLLPALAMAEYDHKRSELDDERQRFIHHAMRQLIEELSDEAKARQTRSNAAATEQAAKDGPAPDPVSAQRIPVPNDCEINVLCLPAADEADEISGLMLAQVLEHHGYHAINVAVAALASEMVSMVEEKQADLVCVCAMPPAAVAHARYLCKRLHTRHAELKIIVGLWTLKGDREKARRRITGVESAPLCISLTEAMNQIEQLAHSALVAARSGVKA